MKNRVENSANQHRPTKHSISLIKLTRLVLSMESRYSRQEAYSSIGKEGQKILSSSTVAVIGLGALGSVVSELLARAGINLVIVDRDIVELSNLQRQVIFTEKDINKPKADAAKEYLQKVNSGIDIETINDGITEDNIDKIKADIIVDCTDNMETRFLLNRYCVQNSISLIHGSAVANKGFIYNVLPGKACLRCIYQSNADSENCQSEGILNSVSTTIGSMQANEAIKILLNNNSEQDMLHIDLRSNEISRIKVKKNINCPVCTGKQETKAQASNLFKVELCKTHAAMKTTLSKNGKLNLENIKKTFDTVLDTPILLVVKADGEEIIVHSYGELMFKTLKDEKRIEVLAKKIYEVGLA